MTRNDRIEMSSRIGGLPALLVLALLGMFGVATPTLAQDAAVQLDAVSGPASGTGETLIWSHTVGTQTNRWLVVGISLNNSFANGYYVASVTWQVPGYAAQTLQSVQGIDSRDVTRRVEQWELGSPNPGSGSITAIFNKSVTAVAGSVSLWNVSSRSTNACDTPRQNFPSSTATRSESPTYERDGLVDVLAVPGNITAALMSGTAQTQRWNTCTGSCGSTDLTATGSTQPASPGNPGATTFNWALSGNTYWALCGVDYAPFDATLAHLRKVAAFATGIGTVIRWETSYEVDNLGFHLFRETADGSKVEVTPSLVAGSALFAGQGTVLRGGRSYQWIDTSNLGGTGRYWLEDVSIDGISTMRGPILPQRGPFVASTQSLKPPAVRNSMLLKAVGANSAASAPPAPATLRRVLRSPNSSLAVQWKLAGMNAARIGVRQEGWYRVTKADLLAAGFDPGTDPTALRLFDRGVEQAISVVPGSAGSFDSTSYIEFYGSGVDTPTADTNVYWLVKDRMPGPPPRRIDTEATLGGQTGVASYRASVERRDRTVYFAALLDTTRDNFFGPTITSSAATQALTVDRISPDQTPAPTLDVAVQGATSTDHRVAVSLNGHDLGEVDFSGITYKTATLAVDPSYLIAGNNVVSLVALGDSTDVSLVDYMRIDYQRLLYADADVVDVTAAPLQAVTVKGFTTPHVRVIDVSRPEAVVELPGQVSSLADGYAVTVTPAPVYFGPGAPAAQNALYAFTEEQTKTPASIQANSPSSWNAAANRADMVIVAHHDFIDAANTLAAHRSAQGIATQVVDVQQAYDEFSYGIKDPQAIRDLLARAKTTWRQAPRFVLLFGDATSDPRDYLGDAKTDFVPTKMVPLQVLKSASDDWFVDFNDTGYPQMAIGRIPAQTAAEAATVVGKLIQYDATAANAGWTRSATFVSDANDPSLRVAFVDETHAMEQLVPAALARSEVLIGSMDSTAARSAVLSALNAGSLLVTYIGHGTDESWTTSNLFNTTDAAALSNGAQLPVFSALNCLNGLFEDPSNDSLGEALLKAPAGGAVAVLASTALTDPEPQLILGKNFYTALFNSTGVSVGQALMAAKTSAVRESVRQSFLLLGDPSMQLRR
jgi:Peptidase family C25